MTCACACPDALPEVCGSLNSETNPRRCVAACGTGQLRDPVTCQCVDATPACTVTNCEGCCGTTVPPANDPICRPGTANANCGANGVSCQNCTTMSPSRVCQKMGDSWCV